MHDHRFPLTFLAFVLFAGTSAGAAPAQPLAPRVVKSTQRLANLLSGHEAFSKPSRESRSVVWVQAHRPITGERTVLPVIGHRTTGGIRWLHVKLPGRPNGHSGWIRQRYTFATTTSWHVVVDISTRRVIAYRNGHVVRTFRAVVGKLATPTPLGEFFVEESVLLRPGDVGAPFALALSARSDVLQEFEGGPGQIALHGLANVGGIPGTAVSHGCVRLDSDTMRWLVARLDPGVPVTVSR